MIAAVNQLSSIRDKHAEQKIVLTSGTYDLIHIGHLQFLAHAKSYGDVLVVLLSGDDRVRVRKGLKRPIIPEQQRAQLLDGLKVVDYVVIDHANNTQGASDPIYAYMIQALKPEYYVTDGPDERFMGKVQDGVYITLDRINAEPSTTAIIRRIIALYKS